MYEQMKKFINPELYVLIFVLYIIGNGLKASKVPDRFIPFILGAAGILLSTLFIAASTPDNAISVIFNGITQGLLCAGGSVYINQLKKQITEKK